MSKEIRSQWETLFNAEKESKGKCKVQKDFKTTKQLNR